MLTCGICQQRFSSNDELRQHLEQHASQMFDIDEELQEKEIKTERDLDQDSDEESLVLDCVKEEEQLQGQNHQEETQYEEVSEEFTSVTPSEASKKRRKIRGRPSSSKTLNCSKYSYKTIDKDEFRHHMKQMHPNNVKCDHCPKRYRSKGCLANHIRKEHTKDEDKTKLPEDELIRKTEKRSKRNQRLYECQQCTFQHPSRFNIYRHIRSVHKNLLNELYKSKGMIMDDAAYHKCTKCSYKTLEMGNLKKHIKRVHQKKCDLKFVRP